MQSAAGHQWCSLGLSTGASLLLFNVSIDDLDEGIACTWSVGRFCKRNLAGWID